jgi:hypothetical protein
MIDNCKNDLDNIIVRALAAKNASQYKKRIEKEIIAAEEIPRYNMFSVKKRKITD